MLDNRIPTYAKISLKPALIANFLNSGTFRNNVIPSGTGCSISPTEFIKSKISGRLNISKCESSSSSSGMVTNKSRNALARSCSFLNALNGLQIFSRSEELNLSFMMATDNLSIIASI